MNESPTVASAPTYFLTRDLFLRLLGLVFLAAFLSLRWQIIGLLGADGVLPAQPYLERAQAVLGSAAPWRVPSVFWLGARDAMLHGVCVAGIVVSLLLVAGLVPLAALAIAWFLYLSLVSIGQTFLSYQWDGLLLETGFLALFWTPLAWRLDAARVAPPSRIVLWLVRWLLFRLMFFSGFVKLASGDPTWWHLQALEVHYQTQPLPAWTSWYAHQLPSWLQRASCAVMFVIELVLPFFVVLGRRARAIAFCGLVALQLGIAATGNYGFFNMLSAVLCVPLLDDGHLARFWPRRLRPAVSRAADASDEPRSTSRAQLAIGVVLAIFLGLLTIPLALSQLSGRRVVPAPLATLADAVTSFRLTGTYGLFAVMTTTRPELTLEGSVDGVEWRPYVFRWKPGPLDRAPSFAGTDMPRLDWQMWFDALYAERMLESGRGGSNLITPALLARLRSGSRSVLDLLAADPFDGELPRQLRWRLDDYRFTDGAQRSATGDWWRRTTLHEQLVPP